MTQCRAHAFSTINCASPLLLASRHDIPVLALKSIIDFTGEISISPIGNIQEISNLFNIDGITKNDFFVRLLASPLKGKALQWYRDLPHNSITNQDALGVGL